MKQATHLLDNEFRKEIDKWATVSKDYNDFVPFIVSDCITKLSMSLSDLLEKDDDFYEVYRQHLNTRGKSFERAINELLAKYSWVHIVNKNINKEKKPFVLYLQDFEQKTYMFEHGTMRKAENYSGMSDICELAEKNPEIIFVYVGVPMDDSGIDYACLNVVNGRHKNVLRIDCDKNWLETVERYIDEASCIVVNVRNLGEGTKKEIDYIKKNKLLYKTCLISEDTVIINNYLGQKVNITDENFEEIKKIYKNNENSRSDADLPVSAMWIEGELRSELEEELDFIETESIKNFKKHKKQSAAIQLDVCFAVLGIAIALEDFSRIVSYLFPIINLLSVYSSKILKNRNKQVISYLSYFIWFEMTLKTMGNYTANIEDNEMFVNTFCKTSFFKRVLLLPKLVFSYFELRRNICVRKK